MPINETKQGKNVFNPKNRIVQSLGQEYVAKTEQNAFDRLSKAGSSGAMRAAETPVEETNTNDPVVTTKEFARTINRNGKDRVRQGASDYSALSGIPAEIIETRNSDTNSRIQHVFGYATKMPYLEKRLTSFTNIRMNTPVQTVNCALYSRLLDAAVSISTVKGMSSLYKETKGKDVSKIAVKTGLYATVNLLNKSFSSINRAEFNSLWNTADFTNVEISQINHISRLEQLKFGVRQTGLTIFAPALIKLSMDKFLPKSVTDHKNYKTFPIFESLTFVGSMVNTKVQELVCEKSLKKLRETDSSTPEGYKVLSKAATNVALCSAMDLTKCGAVSIGIGSTLNGIVKHSAPAKKLLVGFTKTAEVKPAVVKEVKSPVTVAKPVAVKKPTTTAPKAKSSK